MYAVFISHPENIGAEHALPPFPSVSLVFLQQFLLLSCLPSRPCPSLFMLPSPPSSLTPYLPLWPPLAPPTTRLPFDLHVASSLRVAFCPFLLSTHSVMPLLIFWTTVISYPLPSVEAVLVSFIIEAMCFKVFIRPSVKC